MSFLLQQMLGDKLKNMTGGGTTDGEESEGGKESAASKGMSREEFEEYQKQLIEEKITRDKEFATKKAERANLRVLMRDKYRIPQSAQDEATVQMAGDDLDIPEELAKMVDEDEEQEEMNDSFLGKLQNMDVDFDSIKAKAQSTMTEVKQVAEEKCVMM
ncbi:complexin-4-like [Carassius auratus]|uniref:Complexin-4-like n=1 Tax=Carassius auratus TaxID=7957 RepID=A0A6P6QA00_CARAU|nr:complexin-4-like [Carassius auratus]XP_026130365.1 complexin-4-like [Carassius auratus]XP_052390604.1 complexin-4c [Carassius gibelio]